MHAIGGPTTLADERRKHKLLSQQRTASSRVTEDHFDSSSDEEEPNDDNNNNNLSTPDANTDTLNAFAQTTDANTQKEDIKNEYEAEKKKKNRRPKFTLKPVHLADPQTGLSQLMHEQPKLSKQNSVTAAAAYTRNLFAHYHKAVRHWNKGNVGPNDTTWMTQVEKLSSQKVVRDHLDSLRQVICRNFVEDKVGLEKAERWFEQLETEAAAVVPDQEEPVFRDKDEDNNNIHNSNDSPAEETMMIDENPRSPSNNGPLETSVAQPATVSPPQPPRENNDINETDPALLELERPTRKRALGDNLNDNNNNGATKAPASKRRFLDDESDDELEFEDGAGPNQDETTRFVDSKSGDDSFDTAAPVAASKRRVLEDDSDDEDDEPEFEDKNDIEKPMDIQDQKTVELHTESKDKSIESNERSDDPAVPSASDHGLEQKERELLESSDARESSKNDKRENATGKSCDAEESLEADPENQLVQTFQGSSESSYESTNVVPSTEANVLRIEGTQEESSNNNVPEVQASPSKGVGNFSRLEVLEEFTQPSSPRNNMALGQDTQFTTQATQDDGESTLFMPEMATKRENPHGAPRQLEKQEDIASEAATGQQSKTNSLSEEEASDIPTQIPSENDPEMPSLPSETQATIIASSSEEIPTQMGSF